MLFRADKVNRGIESISSDGRSASVVITHQTGPPTDVVKHGNEIYWTDMFSQDLKFRSGGSQYVRSIQIGSFDPSSTDGNHTNFFPKMAIINKDISYMGDLRDSHECSWMNPNRKNCSHICLIDGEGFNGVCVCPEGLTLDEDGITCRFVSTCSQHQFTCKDGHCINLDYVCDGVPDCSDHDDEVNCQSTKCPEGHFQCEANGMCVSSKIVLLRRVTNETCYVISFYLFRFYLCKLSQTTGSATVKMIVLTAPMKEIAHSSRAMKVIFSISF